MAFATASGDASGTSVTTGTANFTGMKLIVVRTSNFASSNVDSATAITDSSSNTYTKISATTTFGHAYGEFFYCANPTVSSSMTFTYHTSSGFLGISVLGYDGFTTPTLDQGGNSLEASEGASPRATPNATTTHATELVLVGFGNENSSGSTVASNGTTTTTFTVQVENGGSNEPCGIATSLVSATGTYGGSVTGGGGGAFMNAGICSFYDAGGGGGGFDPSTSRFPDDYGTTDAGYFLPFLRIGGY